MQSETSAQRTEEQDDTDVTTCADDASTVKVSNVRRVAVSLYDLISLPPILFF